MKRIVILVVGCCIAFWWLKKMPHQNSSGVRGVSIFNQQKNSSGIYQASVSTVPPPEESPLSSENQIIAPEKLDAGIENISMKKDASVVSDFFSSKLAPQSGADLIQKIKPLKMPTKPGRPDQHDGSLTGVFLGYVKNSQTYTRVKVSSAYSKNDGNFGTLFSLEDASGFIEVDSDRNLKQGNFSDDPYSLIYTLPDRRIVYLKFFPVINNGSSGGSGVRVLSGWVYSPDTKVAYRIALIDKFIVSSEGETWPDPNEIEPLFPMQLLK